MGQLAQVFLRFLGYSSPPTPPAQQTGCQRNRIWPAMTRYTRLLSRFSKVTGMGIALYRGWAVPQAMYSRRHAKGEVS